MTPNLPRSVSIVSVIALAVVLSGCGSGSNEPANVSAAQTSASPTTAASTSAASSPPQAPVAQEAVAIVNSMRAKGQNCGGVEYPAQPPVKWQDQVAKAAQIESEWMQSNNLFSHTWPDGTGPGERLKAANYNWSSYGENIAAGQPDVNAVMAAWLASPGHCVNIMRSGVADFGLAKVDGNSNNRYSNYWTMVVASAR